MTSPRQITLRNPSPELSRQLKAIAAARGQSLNATILTLLEDAVGIAQRRRRLEGYATWSTEEVREFEDALEAQRSVDPVLWK